MRFPPVLPIVVAVGLVIAGCAVDDAAPREAIVPGAVDAADLRFDRLSVTDGREVVATVAAGDVGMLVWVQADDIDAEVVLEALVDPDGVDVIAEVTEPVGLGELTVALPVDLDAGMQEGAYRLVVSGGPIIEARSVAKSGPLPDASVIDLRIVVVDDAVERDDRDQAAEVILRAGERLFKGSGVAPGALSWVDAEPPVSAAFADLDLPTDGADEEARRLCGTVASTLVPARSATVIVVRTIIDEDEPDAETEGNAGGIPGAALVPGAVTGCVVVAVLGSRSIFDRASVVWHEIGHLLGLAHTTEAEGDVFDLLDDTPECDAATNDDDDDGFVDEHECGAADGGNFMFHDTDALGITPDQVERIRRHPLSRSR